jgi:hypothetical protein
VDFKTTQEGKTMPRKTVELLSGFEVQIAYTEDEKPTEHGEEFNRQWKQVKGREGLEFYESTKEYMRNDWIDEPGNMRSTEVKHKDQTLLLFFDEKTRTWNSSEALDIDHKQPWLQHFHDRGVWSKADAMLAYNDVDNLHMVSATYNRARSAADRILEEHGPDSDQWRDWVERKLRFDTGKDYPAYDPDRHGATRTVKTTEAEWTDGVSRDGLKFDAGIKKIWYEHALKEAYVGDVIVPDPDHPDDRSRDHSVQLFECGPTGQYMTQGGIDIDHKVSFAEKLGALLEENQAAREEAELLGLDPVPPVSKAQVKDLYNDAGNLRLASRSANSSHEWEVGLDGELYDPDLDYYEYASAEPTVTVVDDGAPIVYEDASTVPKKREREDEETPRTTVDDEPPSERATKREKVDVDDTPLNPRDAVLLRMQSQDFELYQKLVGEVGKLDPTEVGPLTGEQRENVAMSLLSSARQFGLSDIDHVVSYREPGHDAVVFGVQGPLDADTGKVWLPVDRFKHQPMEVTAQLMIDHTGPVQDHDLPPRSKLNHLS